MSTRFAAFLLLGFLLLGPAPILGAADDPPKAYRVVVHPDVDVTEVSGELLEKIFLVRRTRWKGGQKIHPGVLKRGRAHEAFIRQVLKKHPSQYASYCKVLVFTGKGHPPKRFDEEAALLDWVARTPGAIGYVGTSIVPKEVKTVP